MADLGTKNPPTASALLIFDGDCSFCTSAVDRLAEILPVPPRTVPYQFIDLEPYALTERETDERIWLIAEDGRQFGGYLAFAEILKHQPNLVLRFLGQLSDTAPWSWLNGVGYALMARYRHLLPGGTPACRMAEAPARGSR